MIHAGDHGTTFGGGPVTTAVALKVWETVSAPGFLPHVREMGELLRAGTGGAEVDASPDGRESCGAAGSCRASNTPAAR